MFTREDILQSLYNSPTPSHYMRMARKRLTDAGFVELFESDDWEEVPNKFFVVRDERSVIAINKKSLDFGLFIGAHCDSPCFRIKPNSPSTSNIMETVSVGGYGGGMWYSWVDRDLSIAGRAMVKRGDKVEQVLFHTPYPAAFIPSLPIQLDPKGSLEPKFNLADHFSAVISLKKPSNATPTYLEIIREEIGCNEEDIIDVDAYLVPHQKPASVGFNGELLASARLDDLSCSIGALRAFCAAADPVNGFNCLVIYDNEEHGSNTTCGAKSNFLKMILQRIGCNKQAISKSLFLSADNTHGYHPNFAKENDATHQAVLGNGPCYTWHASMALATDTTSLSIPLQISKKFQLPLNPHVLRNEQRTGSTIGPHISSYLGIPTVDLGIPVLGMHSIRETASFKDWETFEQLMVAFLETYATYK